MALKVANDEVYFRIKSAGALKAAGIRLGNKEMEEEGRANYAEAFVENAILFYREDLTEEARAALARLLFATPDPTPTTTNNTQEPDQADLNQLRSANTPHDLVPASELPPETLYDPDNEVYDEEDEEYDEDLDD